VRQSKNPLRVAQNLPPQRPAHEETPDVKVDVETEARSDDGRAGGLAKRAAYLAERSAGSHARVRGNRPRETPLLVRRDDVPIGVARMRNGELRRQRSRAVEDAEKTSIAVERVAFPRDELERFETLLI